MSGSVGLALLTLAGGWALVVVVGLIAGAMEARRKK